MWTGTDACAPDLEIDGGKFGLVDPNTADGDKDSCGGNHFKADKDHAGNKGDAANTHNGGDKDHAGDTSKRTGGFPFFLLRKNRSNTSVFFKCNV